MTSDHAQPEPAVAPPRRIGRYEIASRIGAGGMGTVYKARETQLNRAVAVKFLSPDLADESARRCLQQEAKMASALTHPHILTVHEAGEVDGQRYLVTEFVNGSTLEDWSRAEQRRIGDIGLAGGTLTEVSLCDLGVLSPPTALVFQ